MTSLKSSLRNLIPKKYRTKFGGKTIGAAGGRRKSLSGGKKHESTGILGVNKSKKEITGGRWPKSEMFNGGRKRAKTSKRKRRKNSKKSKRRYRRTKRKGG
jgi:hypothetical protein